MSLINDNFHLILQLSLEISGKKLMEIILSQDSKNLEGALTLLKKKRRKRARARFAIWESETQFLCEAHGDASPVPFLRGVGHRAPLTGAFTPPAVGICPTFCSV